MCSILHGPTPIEGKCEDMSLLRGCDPFRMIRIIHMWPHGGVNTFGTWFPHPNHSRDKGTGLTSETIPLATLIKSKSIKILFV